MSYSVEKKQIVVNDVVYDVKRERDMGGSGEESLHITEFNVQSDEWEYIFDGLEATLGYEEGDTSHANPRDWSNVGVISVYYRGYDLGDEDIRDIDFDYYDEEKDEYLVRNPVEYFKKERGARVVLPVIVFDHSMITMKIGHVGDIMGDSAGWDTSFVGFIFDTPETVKECMGDNVTDEQIEEALRQEMDTYASYLEGDVMYFSVQDEETGFHESCFGFVGDHEECERQCFEALESAVERRLAENNEREEWNARGTETR
jgi:hypothetical protein